MTQAVANRNGPPYLCFTNQPLNPKTMNKFDRIMDPIMNALTGLAILGTLYWIVFRCVIAYITNP